MHSLLRVALAYVPALHAAGLAAPPAHAKPAPQSKQSGTPSESETLPYLPGKQLAGSSRLDPTGQKLPSLHATQATAPSALWCDPASHSAHRSLRLDGAYEPAAHGVGAVAPSGQKLPALHAAHSSAPPRSVVLPCDPLGQGRGALEPGRQNDPGSQPMHAVAFASGCRLPAGQDVQESLRVVFEYVPGWQRAGGCPPPPHEKPAGQSKHSGSPSTSETLAYVPGAHVGASLSDAPSGQKSPASQRLQAVASTTSW